MKTKKLLIIGSSSNSKLARFYFDRDTEYEVIAYAIQRDYIKDDTFDGLPVLALEEIHKSHPASKFSAFVAVGYSEMNALREKLYNLIKEKGYILPNYISPRCNYLTSEPMGDNNLILEDNTIQPMVKIGSNNVFWSGNHIGHDVQIGNHNFISSHVVISGFTHIHNNCFLGVNSTFRDAIHIHNFSLVAAGAVIMENTEEYGVYVPPKTVKINKKSTDIRIS